MAIQSAKGTYDIMPEDVYKWQYLEDIIHKTCELYNYREIRTPIFESTELFVRGVGESTDIVTKEMYTFLDKGERSITLRPEGTAGVVRAFVEHKLYAEPNNLTKLYYIGPMFRYERMQKGRTRQFYQFGAEVLGGENPQIDAEVITLAVRIFKTLGLKSVKVIINSLGDKDSRGAYRQALIDHFTPVKGELCEDCERRLNQNPLRLLDCKVDKDHPSMKSAPRMNDYLNDYSRHYFEAVLKLLNQLGIEYETDPTLVRGLDYYNHTVFEIHCEIEGFGAQNALGGGGRYNGLVAEVGGADSPGVGFAFGMDRLLLALEAEGTAPKKPEQVDVYIAAMNEEADELAFSLLEQFRQSNITCEKDFFGRKLKGQFKQADKLNAKFTVIIGEEEMRLGNANLKNMTFESQETIKIGQIVEEIKKRLEENEYGKQNP